MYQINYMDTELYIPKKKIQPLFTGETIKLEPRDQWEDWCTRKENKKENNE